MTGCLCMKRKVREQSEIMATQVDGPSQLTTEKEQSIYVMCDGLHE